MKPLRYENGVLTAVGGMKVHALANLNPLVSPQALEALEASIRDYGQLTDVLMYKGYIVDGRSRVLACTRLGLSVAVKSLPRTISLKEVRDIVKSVAAQRYLCRSQRAMQAAYALADDLQLSNKEAVGLYDSSWDDVKAAEFIHTNYPHIGSQLFDGHSIEIGTYARTGAIRHTVNVVAVASYLLQCPRQ